MILADGGRSFVSIHLGHLLLFGAWALAFAGAYACSRLRSRTGRQSRSATVVRAGWSRVAAAASVLGGAVHLSVIREHFGEAALYGWFFLVLTAVQFGWAARVVWRPSRAVLVAGAVASTLVVLLWLATRTVAIPLGPEAGELESFGVADVLASVAELVVAAAAVRAVHATGARVRVAAVPAS